MVALPDEAFKAPAKEATSIAKQLNYEVQQIEAESSRFSICKII